MTASLSETDVYASVEASSAPMAGSADTCRYFTLDLIRGLAVLGILTINIASFAGPQTQSVSPCFGMPPQACERLPFAVSFVLFEGKMRMLFAMLFGAGLSIFTARMDGRGFDGNQIQVRRLGWLMVLGMVHYLLLWSGDILFVYGCCGLLILPARAAPKGALLSAALALWVFPTAWDVWLAWPGVAAEAAFVSHRASLADMTTVLNWQSFLAQRDIADLQLYRSGYLAILSYKLLEQPFWLLKMTLSAFTEIIPAMLLGLILARDGFFTGIWPKRRLLCTGSCALFAGMGLTVCALLWVWPSGFPPVTMTMLLNDGLVPAHILTAFGYAALLAGAAPWLARFAPGAWLARAGRMAFSNYIASSILMTALFYGWGMGLYGSVGPARQWLFVLLGWAMMLGFSRFWLRHFDKGPLENLWRTLIAGRRPALDPPPA